MYPAHQYTLARDLPHPDMDGIRAHPEYYAYRNPVVGVYVCPVDAMATRHVSSAHSGRSSPKPSIQYAGSAFRSSSSSHARQNDQSLHHIFNIIMILRKLRNAPHTYLVGIRHHDDFRNIFVTLIAYETHCCLFSRCQSIFLFVIGCTNLLEKPKRKIDGSRCIDLHNNGTRLFGARETYMSDISICH
jgi:hypothetical protein